MKRILLCAALLAWSGLASAVVYKWVDSQGKTMYGDHPPDGVHAEVVELYTHGSRTASPPPAASNSAANKSGTSLTPNSASPEAKAKKEVDADVAATKEKQCADAQTRYKSLIEGRRLFKTGENGERQYLNSEEIDAERIKAKTDLDTICNSAT